MMNESHPTTCISTTIYAEMDCLFLTCDLGLDLSLHLQRVDEDAAITDEAGTGNTSVRLAESLFIKIIPES